MFKTLLFIGILFSDTAFTKVSVEGGYAQSTQALSGTSAGGFGIRAQSIYDWDGRHRVFGEASYRWGQSQGNEWVEDADYERLYPYLTVDSVCGGLSTEEYFFRGGYVGLYDPVVWHIALQYRAQQSYRRIDPRPENKVADLCLEGSVGLRRERYAYSLNLNLQRYKQTNKVTFYSELGETMLFHMVQPGSPYTRFSGGFKSAYYHGMSGGAALVVQPFHAGWLGTLGYQYERVTKELVQSTNTPIAQLAVHRLDMDWGYLSRHWHAVLNLGYALRRGEQYLYGESTGNYYQFLAAQQNYTEHLMCARLVSRYTALLPVGRLTASLHTGYTHSLLQSAEAQALFPVLARRLLSPAVGLGGGLEYAFPLTQRVGMCLRPAVEYTRYIQTMEYTWQVRFALAITL